MKIVVTNDDGITSNGIKNLVDIAKTFGEVIVVAPDSPQSGMGHAITIGETLRLEEVDIFKGIEAYACSGTPADCVKMAKNYLLKDSKPDLVLSGVNHGANTSISVLYSGTMSAAIEAAVESIPSIGFSLCEYGHEAPMDHAFSYMEQLISESIDGALPKGVALNVNIPPKISEPIKGVEYCRQSKALWEERFEVRVDPLGRRYFWLGGDFVSHDAVKGTDEWAIKNNYISVVPCQYDLTDYKTLEKYRAKKREQ